MSTEEETFTEREKLIARISYTKGHMAALENVSKAMRDRAISAAGDALDGPFIGAVFNGFADALDRVVESNKGRTAERVDPAPEQVSP